MTVQVDELSFHSPTGGRFQTELHMADDDITAKLALDHFDTGSYLPAGLKKLGAGKAQGRLRIDANIGEKKSVKLSDLNLAYQRTSKGGGIPRSVRVSGQAQASAEMASTQGLHIAYFRTIILCK